jgi:hypothetical protein
VEHRAAVRGVVAGHVGEQVDRAVPVVQPHLAVRTHLHRDQVGDGLTGREVQVGDPGQAGAANDLITGDYYDSNAYSSDYSTCTAAGGCKDYTGTLQYYPISYNHRIVGPPDPLRGPSPRAFGPACLPSVNGH